MVWYHTISVYHVDTQCFTEITSACYRPPLATMIAFSDTHISPAQDQALQKFTNPTWWLLLSILQQVFTANIHLYPVHAPNTCGFFV